MLIAELDDQIQMREVDAILSFLPRFRDLDPTQACIRWPGFRVEDDQLIFDRCQKPPACPGVLSSSFTSTALFGATTGPHGNPKRRGITRIR